MPRAIGRAERTGEPPHRRCGTELVGPCPSGGGDDHFSIRQAPDGGAVIFCRSCDPDRLRKTGPVTVPHDAILAHGTAPPAEGAVRDAAAKGDAGDICPTRAAAWIWAPAKDRAGHLVRPTVPRDHVCLAPPFRSPHLDATMLGIKDMEANRLRWFHALEVLRQIMKSEETETAARFVTARTLLDLATTECHGDAVTERLRARAIVKSLEKSS